ncbi:MAG: hypothetical protein MJE68_05835 [Proteobacteria bacterium]|nr:hypothetical protein [Pseudomonadota bacterium]
MHSVVSIYLLALPPAILYSVRHITPAIAYLPSHASQPQPLHRFRH